MSAWSLVHCQKNSSNASAATADHVLCRMRKEGESSAAVTVIRCDLLRAQGQLDDIQGVVDDGDGCVALSYLISTSVRARSLSIFRSTSLASQAAAHPTIPEDSLTQGSPLVYRHGRRSPYWASIHQLVAWRSKRQRDDRMRECVISHYTMQDGIQATPTLEGAKCSSRAHAVATRIQEGSIRWRNTTSTVDEIMLLTRRVRLSAEL
jgi:hypothetical protein